MDDYQRRLLWHGMFLFLLGLINGVLLLEIEFTNPRMGLAAHLEAMTNATFLLALGAGWTHVKLSPRLKTVVFWGILYSTYANWGFTLLGSIFGTGALSAFAAPGRLAEPYKEQIITLGLYSVGAALFPSVILILWGLRRTSRASSEPEAEATDTPRSARVS
jgi:hydroxylaminobenzene mutase